ncbi:DNA topoisomerase (ATP-hydrolyzing) [Luteitalea sp. TBR-22]|uniref:DNA gyrase/topoisomerase IV subunit A n=1 Tax=Luteitalea sp. TBR-22 TaxID=2802971 RepID=UPI001AF67B05|nr:DNA topoisomerase IV subunit A [Luteitalea sp. TBR-22]BCS33431.1 DNA topoisomerase (ATP-hydrolyzing) [Luteitalea sp. TBR-22]
MTEPNLFDLPESPDGGGTPPSGPGETVVPLHEAAQTRYLNYALSVITSRALPDVRDGLKPVQRRILYTMWQQNLTADAKHRKCAKVVGDVMGNYHPHGDSALYETLVRMAQPFSLRYPLIDGSGNFGSLDGDGAAAMRYTECRLARISDELLTELDQDTVPFRPNYDGTRSEPVVLPSRVPTLLINGAMGIAVGMATNVPPHHLGEVCTALLRLIDNPELTTLQLCRYVKGPDFPTGGQILNSPDELKEIYRTGSGAIRLRGMWEQGEVGRATKVVTITAIPYTVDKSELVTRIADLVVSRKLPPLLDVRDVSTDDIRVELEIKRDADEALVMAYLCKHTPLQISLGVNLTCLIPTEQDDIGRPERLDLKAMLWHFLHFRMDVVARRLEHEAATLVRRLHILEGFEKVFDALDEILDIVRKSDGKADAAAKIITRFGLDEEQTDAILELKVYRLARLEILVVQRELADKRERLAEIRALLADEAGRWTLVRNEIAEVQKLYSDTRADRRRTTFASDEDVVEYDADAFIIEEDNVVVVSRDGWIKRQKEVKDPATTRLREGDEVLAAVGGSTRATLVLFTTLGVAYTCRFVDVPASTGYGEPVQRLFKFKDGERVVAVMSLDPRVSPDLRAKTEGDTPPRHALAATSDGYALRFSLEPYLEPSTRAGRKFARLPDGAEIVGVVQVTGQETIIAATREARAMLCPVEEVNVLSGPGRGVILIKIEAARDRLLGFIASRGDRDLMVVETSRGAEQTVSTAKYEVTSRGGKGRELLQRGTFTRIVPPPPVVVGPAE